MTKGDTDASRTGQRPSGVRLIRTHPDLDYDALERAVEQRLTRAIGVGEPTAGGLEAPAGPALHRRLLSRLVATRFMWEELVRYPRLYRSLRRLYQSLRSSQ